MNSETDLTEQDWISARKSMAYGGQDLILSIGSDNLDYNARLIEIDNRTPLGIKMVEIYKRYQEWIDENRKEANEYYRRIGNP